MFTLAVPNGLVQLVANDETILLDVSGRWADVFGRPSRDHGLVRLSMEDACKLRDLLWLAIRQNAPPPTLRFVRHGHEPPPPLAADAVMH